ncbi:MAG: cytochrome c biogenesis protein CcdA [Nitriliruptor sp.]|nr:MAG: cytochrome c biogenesis protein CcdA [Nitriliruptor sp.]
MSGLGPEVGFVAAFAGGLLALLSPCGALLLPSFFAYAFDRRGRLLARTGIFYLGLITTLVPLGVSASVATRFVRTQQDTVLTVAGISVIVLGVLVLVGSGFNLLPARLRAGEGGQATSGTVYLLGLVYGITGFCTGPILGSILVLAAVGGRPAQGGALLAVYALGMVVPLALLSLVWERIGTTAMRWLRGTQVAIGRWRIHSTSLLTGLLLIGVGILLVTGSGTFEAGNLALVGARAEEVVQAVGQRIPDRALALLAVAAAGGWFIRRWRAGEPERAASETSQK